MTQVEVNQEATTGSPGNADGQDGAEVTRQYVSFAIGHEQYCVDILAVREFKGWTEITSLPNQAEYVRGVLNLRGVVVPILDMRRKFNMGLTEAAPMHVVIIVSVDEKLIGLLVDSISDILSINDADIIDVPDTGSISGTEYLAGLLTVDDSMIALLDLPVLVRHDLRTDDENPLEQQATA